MDDIPPEPIHLSDGTWDLSGGTGRLIKEVIVEGNGDIPNNNSTAKIEVFSQLEDGKEVENTIKEGKPREFQLCHAYLPGIRVALLSMHVGDKVKLRMDSCYAYGQDGNLIRGVPRNSKLNAEIHFLAITRKREEDYPNAVKLSEEAAIDYHNHNFSPAIEKYSKALELLTDYYDKECSPMRQRLMKNLTTVCCVAKRWNESIKWANKVLALEDKDLKTLLHKARAHIGLCMPKEAAATIELGIEAAEDQQDWKEQFIRLKEDLPRIEKEEKKRELEMFKKMTSVSFSNPPKNKPHNPEEGK